MNIASENSDEDININDGDSVKTGYKSGLIVVLEL